MLYQLVNIYNQDVHEVSDFPYTIGRNVRAKICCRHVIVSKNHATIFNEEGKLFISDSSSNGTFVNNNRIAANTKTEIKVDDEIAFGICRKQISDDTSQCKPPFYIFTLKSPPAPPIICLDDTLSESIATDKESVETDVDVQVVPSPHDEHVIVIDDSDDENAFNAICSQLFVKQEPQIVDEDYLNIKKEIEEFDRYEEGHLNPPITICESSIDSDTDELLSRLKAHRKNQEPMKDAILPEAIIEPLPSASQHLRIVAETITAKYKANKPEVINPLPLVAFSRCRKKQEVITPSTSTSGLQTRSKETNRKEINKKRRESVKEVTLRANGNAAKKPKLSSSSDRKHVPKVKVSENRGMFLTMNLNTRPKRKTSASGTTMSKSAPTASTSRRSSNALDLDVTNIVMTVPAPVATILEHKSDAEKGTKRRRNDRNAKDPRMAFQFYKKHDQFINKILTWNISLFDKSDKLDVIPLWPRISGKPVVKLANVYGNFDYYKESMETLVLSELFSEVLRDYHLTTYTSKRKDHVGTFVSTLEDVIRKPGHTEIICYTYLERKDLAQRTYIKDTYLLTFTVDCGGGKGRLLKTMFGVVGWTTIKEVAEMDQINTSLAKSCKTFPLFKHTFMIIAKNDIKIAGKLHVYSRSFGSLHRHLNRLLAISKVQGIMDKYILFPTDVSFKVPTKTSTQLMKIDPLPPMNQSQTQIVKDAISFCSPAVDSKLFLIEGPPGTGKSFVIVNIIMNMLQHLEDNKAILLLTQSNAAIDNLIERMSYLRNNLPSQSQKLIKMIRIGQVSSASPTAATYHVDELVKVNLRCSLFNNHPHLKKDYQILTHEFHKLRAKKNRTEDEERSYKEKQYEYENFERSHLLKMYKSEEMKTRDNILANAKLICSTVGSCYTFPHHRIHLTFKCCIIDEATQTTEPDTLLPLILNVKKMILVGDTQQLPAFNNLFPKEYLFGRSLFERIKCVLGKSDTNPIRTLTKQYRMVSEICEFPNKMFYNGKLETHYTKTPRKDVKCLVPYIVFEQNGTRQKDHAYINHKEIDIVFSIVCAIDKSVQLDDILKIGIITPYNDQRNEILHRISSLQVNDKIRITCNTIDSFQGQEEDIIVLSFVRNLSNQFVNDGNRLNVALTRAKHALYIVASSILFKSSNLMKALKENAIQRQAYVRTKSHDTATMKTFIQRKDTVIID